MRALRALVLMWPVWILAAYANTPDSGPIPIDAQALNNKRLFFSEVQRQVGGAGKTLATPSKQTKSINRSVSSANPAELRSDEVLHYTGFVHSARGVQLLLNGYPWKPGQLDVVSARMEPETQQIELETTGGALYRLLPGESVEVKP